MDNNPYISFINPHAESYSSSHNINFPTNEIVMSFFLHRVGQSCMVDSTIDSMHMENFFYIFCFLFCQTIYDDWFVRMFFNNWNNIMVHWTGYIPIPFAL